MGREWGERPIREGQRGCRSRAAVLLERRLHIIASAGIATRVALKRRPSVAGLFSRRQVLFRIRKLKAYIDSLCAQGSGKRGDRSHGLALHFPAHNLARGFGRDVGSVRDSGDREAARTLRLCKLFVVEFDHNQIRF